jgi:broad specificity phosphatase PhoE
MYAQHTQVLVTHGLTLRIFLMRWFHWSVDEFLQVYNPANCDVSVRLYVVEEVCLSAPLMESAVQF